jgi:hypothetical protein
VIGHAEIAESQAAGVEVAIGQGRPSDATRRQRSGKEQTAAGLVLSSLTGPMRYVV